MQIPRSVARQSRQVKLRHLGVTWTWSCCRSRGWQLGSDHPCGEPRCWPLSKHVPGQPCRADACGGRRWSSRGMMVEAEAPIAVSTGSPCGVLATKRCVPVAAGCPAILLACSPSPKAVCSAWVLRLTSSLHTSCTLSRQAGPQRRTLVRCPRVQPHRHLHHSPRSPARGANGRDRCPKGSSFPLALCDDLLARQRCWHLCLPTAEHLLNARLMNRGEHCQLLKTKGTRRYCCRQEYHQLH